jgi:protein-S-isoprenylcysteine O-methyltransferase Ste14
MDPRAEPTESIGGLIRGILMDFRALLREEMALIRLELSDQASRARTAAISLGIAAIALLLGATFVLVAMATAIADLLGWPVWTGFLVVAAVMSLVGFVMLAMGRRKLRTVRMVPEQSLSTLKENAEWISKRLSSAQK